MQDQRFLLMYRSLTFAQRAARVLERAGITGIVTRVPKTVSRRGCGYAVSVSARSRDRAIDCLRTAGLAPERVLCRETDGTVREVEHDLS